MLCKTVRTTLEQASEQPDEKVLPPVLVAHLEKCSSCAEYYREMAEVWQALDAFPAIEPSAGFLRDVRSRIAEQENLKSQRRSWPGTLRWRWVALAASFLVLCSILTLRLLPPLPNADVRTANMDAADDTILTELDQVVDRTDDDYLPDYDSWPAAYLDEAGQNMQQAPEAKQPTDNKGRSSS